MHVSVAFPALTAASLLLAAQPARTVNYYIDYRSGDDNASGTSPSQPWKHAPGDPRGTGKASRQGLKPGDRVIFRAGVPYRSQINMWWSGTAEQPIVYTGQGFGAGTGIIDGGNWVSDIRACQSAADCGNAPGWQGLHRLAFALPVTKRIVLFGETGAYYPAQYPVPADAFYSDNLDQFVTTSLSQLANLRAGRLVSADLAAKARAGGKLELAFWVRANHIRRVPVLGVSGDTLLFDGSLIDFYTDRPGKVALMGSFAGLTAGTFVVLEPGLMVAKLRPGENVWQMAIGNGRMGIDLGTARYAHITGLRFRNFVGTGTNSWEGRALTSTRATPQNIEIRGNHFGPAYLGQSNNAILRIMGTRNVRIIGNRIENIAVGAGIIAGGHDTANLFIAGNVIRRVGRSGIYLLGVKGATVRGNILHDIRGIHGNGISTYLDNLDVVVERNCVFNALRPVTFHGDKDPSVPNRITYRNNILVGRWDGQAGINAWGASARQVVLMRNVAAGPRTGILLNGGDYEISAIDNDTSGISVNGDARADWRLVGNTESLGLSDALRGSFSETGCTVPASRLGLVISRSAN
jgi:hypothetical protein